MWRFYELWIHRRTTTNKKKNIQMEYTDFRFLDRDTKGDILDAFIKVYEHEFEEFMKGFSDGANNKELE